jgi:hypothetical protein
MKPNISIGIDPGKSGAFGAILWRSPNEIIAIEAIRLTEPPRDVVDWLKRVLRSGELFGDIQLERVGAMRKDGRKQGVVSTGKFMHNAGWLEGVLDAYGLPFEKVQPTSWQNALKCRTGGKKAISTARAKVLFPQDRFGLKIIQANADALLIAEYGRRMSMPPQVMNPNVARPFRG